MSREVEKDVGGIGEGKKHDQDLFHKILRKINKDKFLQNHFAKKKKKMLSLSGINTHSHAVFCLQC